MKTTSYLLLPFLVLSAVLAARAADEPTPVPAANSPFSLPMSDRTRVTAQFLPAPNGQAWLVYSLPNGHLGLWAMIPTGQVIPPQPDPTPPTPDPIPPKPIPPQPVTLKAVLVENPLTTPPTTKAAFLNPQVKQAADATSSLFAIIPQDMKDPKTGQPPTDLLPFLKAADGNTLPWLILSDQANTILWQGPAPTTPTALIDLLHQTAGK